MNTFSKLTILSAFAAGALTSPAHAIPLTESFGTAHNNNGQLSANYVDGTGGTSSTGINGLFYASQINSGDLYSITGATYGAAGNEAGINGNVLSFTATNRPLTPGNGATSGTITGTFNVVWGGANNNEYSFTASSATYTANNSVTNGLGSQSISVNYIGVFADSLNYFDTQTAALTESFNQTFSSTNTSGVSYGATFSTSPNAVLPVAEPVSMAILGVGLLGLVGVRRRRA